MLSFSIYDKKALIVVDPVKFKKSELISMNIKFLLSKAT